MTTPPTPPTDNLAAEGGPRSEMSEREGLADLLAEHDYRWSSGGGICLCGFVPTVDPSTLWTQQDYHRHHLADLLAARDRRVRGEALREAADDASKVAAECEGTYRESYRPYDQGVADAWDAVADGLRDRADRIEAP